MFYDDLLGLASRSFIKYDQVDVIWKELKPNESSFLVHDEDFKFFQESSGETVTVLFVVFFFTFASGPNSKK